MRDDETGDRDVDLDPGGDEEVEEVEEVEEDGDDDDDEPEPHGVSNDVRVRLLRAIVPAVRQLARAARGKGGIRNDHQRHACVALLRLAPGLLGRVADPAAFGPGYHPSHSPEQAAALLRRLDRARRKSQRCERCDGPLIDLPHNHAEES